MFDDIVTVVCDFVLDGVDREGFALVEVLWNLRLGVDGLGV